jgi:DNA-binding transcriptional ArsR family regulator
MSSGPHREIRKSNILDKLNECQGEYIPTGEIAEDFDVSQETIRNHLEEIDKENEQIKMKNKDKEGVTYLWMWVAEEESTEVELDSTGEHSKYTQSNIKNDAQGADQEEVNSALESIPEQSDPTGEHSGNTQGNIKDDARGADQEAVDSAVESITESSDPTGEHSIDTQGNIKDDARGVDQEAADSALESTPEPSDSTTPTNLLTLVLDSKRSLRRHGRAGVALHQSFVQLFGALTYSFFMVLVRVSELNVSYGLIDELTVLQGTGALISAIVISAYITTKESNLKQHIWI